MGDDPGTGDTTGGAVLGVSSRLLTCRGCTDGRGLTALDARQGDLEVSAAVAAALAEMTKPPGAVRVEYTVLGAATDRPCAVADKALADECHEAITGDLSLAIHCVGDEDRQLRTMEVDMVTELQRRVDMSGDRWDLRLAVVDFVEELLGVGALETETLRTLSVGVRDASTGLEGGFGEGEALRDKLPKGAAKAAGGDLVLAQRGVFGQGCSTCCVLGTTGVATGGEEVPDAKRLALCLPHELTCCAGYACCEATGCLLEGRAILTGVSGRAATGAVVAAAGATIAAAGADGAGGVAATAKLGANSETLEVGVAVP